MEMCYISKINSIKPKYNIFSLWWLEGEVRDGLVRSLNGTGNTIQIILKTFPEREYGGEVVLLPTG